MTPEPATTAGGLLLVPAILVPIVGMILSFALGGRWAGRVALAMSPLWLAIALAIAVAVWRSGAPLVYVVGAVAPPLGLALEADGVSAAMLVVTSFPPPACLPAPTSPGLDMGNRAVRSSSGSCCRRSARP